MYKTFAGRTARVWCGTVIALLVASVARAQTYTLIDIGALSGTAESLAYSVANSINNTGQVVGQTYGPGYSDRGFTYINGVYTDLTTSYGQDTGAAYRINDNGVIAGQNYFLSSPGGTKTDVTGINLYGVNNGGTMVGYEDHYPDGKAVQTRGVGVVGYLTGLNGDTGITSARSINASGQVVGSSMNAGGQVRAVLFQTHEDALDLGTLGGTESTAYDINDAGVIVGYAKLANGYSHAFSYTGGVMADLDPLNPTKQSLASAINALGQAVGYVNRTGQHAALFENGQIIDLNDQVDLVSGGFTSLTYAYDINDLGQIVGYGMTTDRQTHAFLLTPIAAVPEPATWAALLGGVVLLATLGVRGRRRA